MLKQLAPLHSIGCGCGCWYTLQAFDSQSLAYFEDLKNFELQQPMMAFLLCEMIVVEQSFLLYEVH